MNGNAAAMRGKVAFGLEPAGDWAHFFPGWFPASQKCGRVKREWGEV